MGGDISVPLAKLNVMIEVEIEFGEQSDKPNPDPASLWLQESFLTTDHTINLIHYTTSSLPKLNPKVAEIEIVKNSNEALEDQGGCLTWFTWVQSSPSSLVSHQVQVCLFNLAVNSCEFGVMDIFNF